MTSPSANDIPGEDHALACLLPLGWSTFVERTMQSCAQAGVAEVDIVLCDQPEAVRARLGEGERWGLKIRWHLSPSAAAPYKVLHQLGLDHEERVVIGHGHQWLSHRVLEQMLARDAAAVKVGESITWAGWVSMRALFLNAVSPHAQYESLAELAVTLNADHCIMVKSRDYASAVSVDALFQAQQKLLREPAQDELPPTWQRFAWGAMSPEAVVHPQATLHGPLLVGAGCVIERGAQVGPGTVLSRDVFVANGAVIRDSLILPNTYISGDVTVEQAVAQGNAVYHRNWSVMTTLNRSDAIMTPLETATPARAPWTGRLLAATIAVALAPAFLLTVVMQRCIGQPIGWRKMLSVRSGDAPAGEISCTKVRVQRNQSGTLGWLAGRYGALLDVAQARRQWFGVRARDVSEWTALRRDWKILFANAPIGFFHAPAWLEGASRVNSESLAVADAYFAVQAGFGERLRIALALARTWRPLLGHPQV